MNLGGMLGGLAGLFGGKGPAAEAQPASPVQEPEAGRKELTPAELVQLVERRYQWSRRAKEPLLRKWATCLAFLVGEQWRDWDHTTRRLVDPKQIPSWRVRLTENQFPTIVETIAAKLSRARQLPRATPNTGEQQDIAAAQAGTRALEGWWRRDRMDVKELSCNVSRLVFGCAFLHTYWDPAKRARVPVPGPMGMEAVEAPVGDVCCEVLSPFHVFPDPTADAWDNVAWVIVARRKSLEWIVDTFGDVARPVKADGGGDLADVLSGAVPGVALKAAPSSEAGSEEEGAAVVRSYFERPSPRAPDGRYLITAGQVLLYQGPLPNVGGELPVILAPYRLVPERLWPTGLLEHLLGLQRELNRSQSNILESLRLFRAPKWLVAKESRVDPDAITSAPGEVIEYQSGAGNIPPPRTEPPPPLPAWIENLPLAMRESIRQVSGIHEVSQASTPAGVRSGVAIGLLQEEDDSRLHVPNLLGKDALQSLARQVLRLIVARYREPRLIQTLGTDRALQVQALMGADIGDRDVSVDSVDGVADTDNARRQRFMDYLQAGLFNLPPVVQIEVFRELREVWIVEAMQRSNEAMAAAAAAGMPPDAAGAPGAPAEAGGPMGAPAGGPALPGLPGGPGMPAALPPGPAIPPAGANSLPALPG